MAELDSDRDPREKQRAVETTDHEESSHVSDGTTGSEPADESLVAEVSADVAPVIEEFMEQAAQQNEAAADAVPDVRNKPGSYISWDEAG
jgi:phospholipid/cholesterol/gamma-HCH transport system ATP-binding protein